MNNLIFSKTFYSKLVFSIYDKILLKYAIPIIWKCKISDLQNLYNHHISSKHLDIGAGTGFFIRNCKTFNANSKLTIMDINPVCLDICKKQLHPFNPQVHKQDVLKPIKSDEKYNSIGLNLLLHCLPGDMIAKEVVFQNIKNVLNQGGIVFGTTFIIKNFKLSMTTRIWARYFNFIGLLDNQKDTLEDFQKILDKNFKESKIEMIGHCAFFWAKT